eukprot:scaffold1193_cov159-Ochromonas_danica.AAC.27
MDEQLGHAFSAILTELPSQAAPSTPTKRWTTTSSTTTHTHSVIVVLSHLLLLCLVGHGGVLFRGQSWHCAVSFERELGQECCGGGGQRELSGQRQHRRGGLLLLSRPRL